MIKIKCPACESSIEFELRVNTAIICTNCQARLDRSRAEALVTKFLASQHQNQPNSAQLPKTETPDDQSELSANSVVNSDATTDPANVGVPDFGELKASSPAYVSNINRRKNRRMYLLAFLLLVCAAMSGVVYFVFRENVTPALQQAAHNEAAEEIPIEEPSEVDLPELLPTTETLPPAESATDWSRIPFGLIDNEIGDSKNAYPDIKNRFKAKKILDDVWFLSRPYAVELHAETPSGPSFATGTIIDSRGWVLTSYRAVLGANTIHVRRARLDKSDTAEKLSDKVRGYVAVDPARDLAIISVNRRLVETFEDLPIATSDDTFESQYVVQCQSPTLLFQRSSVETRILGRGKLAELDDLDIERLQRQRISAEVDWIHHKHSSPLVSGAPLFNDEGKLIAMNTAFRTGVPGNVVAIPSPPIVALKAAAEDQVQPLPIANPDGDTTPALPSLSVAAEGSGAKIDSDLPPARIIEILNRYGTECEVFGWISKTADDDKSFRQFIAAYVALSSAIADNDSEVTEQAAVQLKQWQDKIDRALGIEANLDVEVQKAFNQKFANRSDSGDVFAGFVYIKFPVTEGPRIGINDPDNPADSIVFEFKGSGKTIIANHHPQWRPMPPDSPWLVIGQRAGTVVRLRDRERELTQATTSRIYTALQSD